MISPLLLIGSSTLELEAFCIEFGADFQTVPMNSLPRPEDIRAAFITETNCNDKWLKAVWESEARVILNGIAVQSFSAGASRKLEFERLVINEPDHPIAEGFQPLDLLDAHSAPILPIESLPDTARSIVCASRVAGFDRAEFGMTGTALPAIVEFSPGKVFSALDITHPAHKRFAPCARWKRLLFNLLAYITETRPVPVAEFPATVPLPFDNNTERFQSYRSELKAAAEWYERSGMLISSDGSKGVLEGFTTRIDVHGDQHFCTENDIPRERADCNIQSAFGFLFSGKALNDEHLSDIGASLLGFSQREFQYRERSVFRGFWKWFRYGYESKVFYSDDNGWSGFFPLLWGMIENDEAALETGLETALALKQTWGQNGHRRRRVNWETFFELDGRAGLRKENVPQSIYKSPHYESSAMALMALATWATGDARYFECCCKGLDEYIAQWPHSIELQHAENDDGSKLITALLFAFLATGETAYRESADRFMNMFIERQDACGAIPEIDRTGKRYGLNRDNTGYGTFESSVFQNDGDPVTDQIYGSSFLALAMVFHGWLFNDPEVNTAMDGLLDYLCNIQMRDTGRTFLDGTWMRSFDFRHWEYFGAAGDWGWGPFAIETGWATSVIMISTALRLLDASLLPDVKSLAARQPAIRELASRIENIHKDLEADWRVGTPRPEARGRQQGSDVMI